MTATEQATLRPFRLLEDYRACVRLQERVWGEGFSERVSPAILKVAQELGGVSAGAFDSAGALIGFVFGMTGLREGRPVHWSDMLAVAPEAAGRGLAVRLKAFQRDAVMSLGVREMLWTFDPLRARNAHLNLNKLGAVVRAYRRDMYGPTDSPLHRGVGTDRFLALWELDSARVEERLGRSLSAAGSAPVSAALTPVPATLAAVPAALAAERPSDGDPAAARPGAPVLDLEAERISIAIPSEIGTIMDHDPPLAVAWREATRAAFLPYLERGYEVRDLLRDMVVSHYLLVRGDEGGMRP